MNNNLRRDSSGTGHKLYVQLELSESTRKLLMIITQSGSMMLIFSQVYLIYDAFYTFFSLSTKINFIGSYTLTWLLPLATFLVCLFSIVWEILSIYITQMCRSRRQRIKWQTWLNWIASFKQYKLMAAAGLILVNVYFSWNVGKGFATSIENKMLEYYGGSSDDVREWINGMQSQYECCGIEGADDWKNKDKIGVGDEKRKQDVPWSCCRSKESSRDVCRTKQGDNQDKNSFLLLIYSKGCKRQFMDKVSATMNEMIVIHVIVAFCEVLTLIVSNYWRTSMQSAIMTPDPTNLGMGWIYPLKHPKFKLWKRHYKWTSKTGLVTRVDNDTETNNRGRFDSRTTGINSLTGADSRTGMDSRIGMDSTMGSRFGMSTAEPDYTGPGHRLYNDMKNLIETPHNLRHLSKSEIHDRILHKFFRGPGESKSGIPTVKYMHLVAMMMVLPSANNWRWPDRFEMSKQRKHVLVNAFIDNSDALPYVNQAKKSQELGELAAELLNHEELFDLTNLHTVKLQRFKDRGRRY